MIVGLKFVFFLILVAGGLSFFGTLIFKILNDNKLLKVKNKNHQCGCDKNSNKDKHKNTTRGPNGQFTEDEKKAGLQAMNNARLNLTPLPTPGLNQMPPLEWNTELEKVAQEHANKCQMGHSSSGYGENIAYGYKDLVAAVQGWDSEKKNINLNAIKNNNNLLKFTVKNQSQWCNGGWSNCGHFTQGVWGKTTQVGCAKASCPNLPYKNVIVCNYNPRGNVDNALVYDTSNKK
jgi:hypothetical protein